MRDGRTSFPCANQKSEGLLSCHLSAQALWEQAAPTPSRLLTKNPKCSRSALSPFVWSLNGPKLIINWTANINIHKTAGCQLVRGLFSHRVVVPRREMNCWWKDGNVDFFSINEIIVWIQIVWWFAGFLSGGWQTLSSSVCVCGVLSKNTNLCSTYLVTAYKQALWWGMITRGEFKIWCAHEAGTRTEP